MGGGRFDRADRPRRLRAVLPREAAFRDGTGIARRNARRADQRAQFHQGLVEVSGAACRRGAHERTGQLPQPRFDRGQAGVFGHIAEPAEHAAHVAIQHRLRLAVGQAQDGTHCVAADAG